MGEAAFRFLGYKFPKIAFDFNNVNPEEEMSVDIYLWNIYSEAKKV